MLTPAEIRGAELKRLVRSAAAMQELYDDATIAAAVGRSRMTVAGWWRGARPEPDTAVQLARVLGFPRDALMAYLYDDGPAPWPPTRATLRPAGPEDASRVAAARAELEDDLDAYEATSGSPPSADRRGRER